MGKLFLSLQKVEIEMRFTNGDIIKSGASVYRIKSVDTLENIYNVEWLGGKIEHKNVCGIPFLCDKDLIPNPKYNPLKELCVFDKVLCRNSRDEKWLPEIIKMVSEPEVDVLNDKNDDDCSKKFVVIGDNRYRYCIPYEPNQHLCFKNEKPNVYYDI